VNDIILRPPVRDFRIKAGGTIHSVRTSSSGKQSIHQGLDFSPEIAGVPGQQIERAIDGEIAFQGETPGFGNQVVVETNLATEEFSIPPITICNPSHNVTSTAALQTLSGRWAVLASAHLESG
jgi:hypothetical protein